MLGVWLADGETVEWQTVTLPNGVVKVIGYTIKENRYLAAAETKAPTLPKGEGTWAKPAT